MKQPIPIKFKLALAGLYSVLFWGMLHSPIAGLFWLLVTLAPVLFAVAGFVFIGLAVSDWRSPSRSALLLAALAWITACPLFAFNRPITNKARFAVERSRYEEKLALVLAAKSVGTPIEKLNISDFAYLDDGPPVRVSFFWSRGVIDNWMGVVYDPTGNVMKVNQLRADKLEWHDPRFQRINMLFGGEIYHAEHLSGHWYLCSFT